MTGTLLAVPLVYSVENWGCRITGERGPPIGGLSVRNTRVHKYRLEDREEQRA